LYTPLKLSDKSVQVLGRLWVEKHTRLAQVFTFQLAAVHMQLFCGDGGRNRRKRLECLPGSISFKKGKVGFSNSYPGCSWPGQLQNLSFYLASLFPLIHKPLRISHPHPCGGCAGGEKLKGF
jgi:hypothetical protein